MMSIFMDVFTLWRLFSKWLYLQWHLRSPVSCDKGQIIYQCILHAIVFSISGSVVQYSKMESKVMQSLILSKNCWLQNINPTKKKQQSSKKTTKQPSFFTIHKRIINVFPSRKLIIIFFPSLINHIQNKVIIIKWE
jgi:hypothetical protein